MRSRHHAAMICGVLLDLSGVVYEAGKAVPGAHEAICDLRAAGLPLRFLTNTTRTTKRAMHERLTGFGLPIEESEIFTPSQAARDWLSLHGYGVHLLVHRGLRDDFDGALDDAPRAVVIGDAAEVFDYEALNTAFRALIGGAPFLALAQNRVFKDEDGILSLDAGPFVKALEFASGREAILLGKPSREFFETALASMACSFDDVVMVGDDMESDVAGALRAGVAQALLVRTGKYRVEDECRFEPAPTGVVDDIQEAARWIIANRR